MTASRKQSKPSDPKAQVTRRCLTFLVEEYPEISSRNLKSIRHENQIFLRARPGEEEVNEEVVDGLIQKHLDNGSLGSKGWKYATTHLKKEEPGELITATNVRKALPKRDPVGTRRRKHALHRKRGQYITRGPNQTWSADGYDKLAQFGFQIYAIIDAFSRYLIHVFVGVSNRTMISALTYYLQAVKHLGFMPLLLRTDKGSETLMMAEAQVILRRIAAGEPLSVRECHCFGPSTKNTKVEAWWSRLALSFASNLAVPL
ncbi:hypothetical protein ABW20_dc0101605 [Dactylellina cionopaga]|nr:hypothetical protein ABW20_dc0101605 [Dactylellina cionopaga]